MLNAQQISSDTCISSVLQQAPLIKLFGDYKYLTKDQLDEVADLPLDLENFQEYTFKKFYQLRASITGINMAQKLELLDKTLATGAHGDTENSTNSDAD